MRLIVVRHYKTQINLESRIMGWGDSPPVDGWEADLIDVDRRLAEAGFDIAEVHTSNLERARRTGQFYAERRSVPVQCASETLNEVDYGTLFQHSKKWVAEHVPEYKTDPDYIFENGESFRQMQSRSIARVQTLASRHDKQTLLLVIHAGVVRGLICHYLQLPYAPNLARRISHRYIGVFEFDQGQCHRYTEIGTHSDFIADGIVQVPYACAPPAGRTPITLPAAPV